MSEKPELKQENCPHQTKGENSKLTDIPIINQSALAPQKKPGWLRTILPNSSKAIWVKKILKTHGVDTVCQQASCPNRGECFNKGSASFMIMGSLCTRHCDFCDVSHGKPAPLDYEEPERLAKAIQAMKLKYVVITSVTRDDLVDGGAEHFSVCLGKIRELLPQVKIEILTPDFRHCLEKALTLLAKNLPDVFNHNIETVPRLYSLARKGADFSHSLNLLRSFKTRFPKIPTKSGIMLGLGESEGEVIEVLEHLRANGVNRLTIGQYLQPSANHLPVKRYVTPKEFDHYANVATSLGFTHVFSAPLVRSSYHADQQDRLLQDEE